jgi:hypothetical protein
MDRIGPRRGVPVRLAMVVIVAVLLVLPVASAHLRDAKKPSIIEGMTCAPCHGNATPEDISIVLDAPTQVSYTPDNRSIIFEMAVLGMPNGTTAFGLILNESEPGSGVRWERAFGDAKGQAVPVNHAKVSVSNDKMVIYSRDRITRDWFNVSFIPGQADQVLRLSVIAMQGNDDGTNGTEDNWTVLENHTIEVKKQRLLNLTVIVSNDSGISVTNAPVDFYIDEEYIGQSVIDSIPPNSDGNATISWDVTFKKDGKYTMRAVIDPDGIITEGDKGNNEVTRIIWLGGPPEPEDRTLLYAAGALVLVAIILGTVWFLYRRRLYRF